MLTSLQLTPQMERQILMQNQMRERQMAMQIAWSREFLKYFGSFFAVATLGLTAGLVSAFSEDAVENDRCLGCDVRGRRVRQLGSRCDEQTDRAQGLWGETVRERVYQSRHFHLRRLQVETIHSGGIGATNDRQQSSSSFPGQLRESTSLGEQEENRDASDRLVASKKKRNFSLGVAGMCCNQGCTKNDIGRLC
ncbi:hypothetical protein XENOCAPTIV_003998 [Xenoophorus captivus]|uniref:Insulin-like domain-containing protein n=1 Tax=Xenoophorus captivus TaxID=1517983 RepID=A0ABV0RBS4_9TELE